MSQIPKLSSKQAAAVEAATAASGNLLLEEGYYAVQLRSCEEREGTEYPYWVWEVHNIHDEDGALHPGRLWDNTSTSPKSTGFMKAVFEAFGYTSDTDTDEIVEDGAWAQVYVTQVIQPTGKNVGQKRNEVQSWSEFVESDYEGAPYPDVKVDVSKSSSAGGAGAKKGRGADF